MLPDQKPRCSSTVFRKSTIKITQDPAKLFTLSVACLVTSPPSAGGARSIPSARAENQSAIFARFFRLLPPESKLNETLDPYLVRTGSASLYLCDLPGSRRYWRSASMTARTWMAMVWKICCSGCCRLICEPGFGWKRRTVRRIHRREFPDDSPVFRGWNGEKNLLDWATKLRTMSL